MRIVFMGTPDFALPSLNALIRSKRAVVAVVTRQDRPKGRGYRPSPPPVKIAAEASGIPVLQPDRIKEPAFLDALRNLEPDLIVVVAYGKILPREVLDLPRYGCVNVHASLLPRYRGAAPVAWAIINGEKQTGVTTMRMNEGLDTGDVYLSETVPILPADTAGTLSARLAEVGAELLLKTLDRIGNGTADHAPQDDSKSTLAPILNKEDGEIDWMLSADRISCLVRGLAPWPGAYTFYQDELWKIWDVSFTETGKAGRPGEVIGVNPDAIEVAAGRGIVSIKSIQPANARRMTTREYLAGHDVEAGIILGE